MRRAARIGLLTVMGCNGLVGIGELSVEAPPFITDPRDSGTDDSPFILEASNDVGDGGGDGFCATKTPSPAFCADFDDAILPGPWTSTDPNTPPRVVRIDDTLSVSAPRSALLGLDPFDAGAFPAALAWRGTTVMTTARLELDVRVGALGANDKVQFVHLRLQETNAFRFLRTATNCQFLQNVETAAGEPTAQLDKQTFTARCPAPGMWTHIALDAKPNPADASAGRVVLSIDGNVVVDIATFGVSPFATPVLDVGMFSGDPVVEPTRVNVDNVVLE